MEKSKRWCVQIDNLYAIGTILVVFGHSHSSDWDTFSKTFLESAINFIYTFHMPLFFLIAGFLFANSNSFRKNGYKIWIKRKAERLLTPYVILSLVALVPKYYIENHGFEGFSLKYVIEALLIPRMGVWGHFWFLPVLMMLYLVFGLGRKLMNGKSINEWCGIILVLTVVLYFLPYSTQWLGFSDFKEAAVFFMLGIIMNCYTQKHILNGCNAYRFLGGIGILISAALVHFGNGSKIMMLLTAIIMIWVCWQMATLIGDNRICKWISKHNFTIYIYSWPFQAVVMELAARMNFSWYMTTLCMFLVGLAVPVLMVLVYKKLKVLNTPFGDLLLGVK